MSNINTSINSKAINKFRDEFAALSDDIKKVDIKVLNKALDAGLAQVVDLSPVDTGWLQDNWFREPARKVYDGVSGLLSNPVDYASHVNYGHRIVVNGKTIGHVEGQFFLEEAVNFAEKVMISEFKKEIKRIGGKSNG